MLGPTLYSDDEVDLIHESSKLVAECHGIVRAMCVPGVTTFEIDRVVAKRIEEAGGTSPFFGYEQKDKEPFPSATCVSINNVVVHGTPDKISLKDGDLLSVDIGIKKDGFVGDSAWTYPIGEPDVAGCRLLEVGERSLRKGIERLGPRTSVLELARAVNSVIRQAGFSAVRNFAGHGVGRSLHEHPAIWNFIPEEAEVRKSLSRVMLTPGMVIAIEPMVNEGTWEVRGDSKWPVWTADGKRSVHFEHTVAITTRGPKVLTLKDWEDPF